MAKRKTTRVAEFGDFQTPGDLARLACGAVRRLTRPKSIFEPTCGKGAFLLAALESFSTVTDAVGLDVNREYVEECRETIQQAGYQARIVHADFFSGDWRATIDELPEPILVIGNPPWVTASELATLGSENVPEKSNFLGFNGFEAISGKSNFDISEWMLMRLFDVLCKRRATLAMLCKTAVARKVLAYAWKNQLPVRDASLHRIDASRFFDAAVDACFLVCRFGTAVRFQCNVFESLEANRPASTFGYADNQVIADMQSYTELKHLRGPALSPYRWRSGVKHDCRKVMELVRRGDQFENGLGETIGMEADYLYPMLKSSELSNGSKSPDRYMLVTQRSTGQDTAAIQDNLPHTWRYLTDHADALDRRGSSIYKNRPRFSVFGVGAYTFAPWKVAISGFYKSLHFVKVGNVDGKPIVLDDTAYLLACRTEEEADLICSLLNSDLSRRFYSSFIFWDQKRPITVSVLSRLDIRALAVESGKGEEFARYCASHMPATTVSV